MLKFVATAKVVLWEFIELAFLAVLALLLINMLLGKGAGDYVNSVAENVSKFATSAGSGLLGALIVLGIIFLALRRVKPARPRS
jgi:hypothetical protein